MRMNTKLIMTASAVLLALIGLSLTFLPNEMMHYSGIGNSKPLQLILQLLGALYFGFAMLNWMAKGSVIGGIYNRPIALANFTHFLIGGLALVKALLKDTTLPYTIWVLALSYSVFAILFWLILYRQPINKQKSKEYSMDTPSIKAEATTVQ
jgi:hypothetical protein